MIKKHKVKLSLQLFIVIIVSAIISIGLFFCINVVRSDVVLFFQDKLVEKKDANQVYNDLIQYLDSFQFSKSGKISKNEEKVIMKELDRYTDFHVSFYDADPQAKNYGFYQFGSSFGKYDSFIFNNFFYGDVDIYNAKKQQVYDVTVNNRPYEIFIYTCYNVDLLVIYLALNILLPIMTFITIILLFITYKTKYLEKIGKSIQQIETGDLKSEIKVMGNDELSELANQLNYLRKTLSENMENEAIAHQSNKYLITAMSHDLRTPLTSLIGYLDIIELKKYQSPEQLQHYVEASKRKAIQIKELSDRLFQYFLVYDINQEIILEELSITYLHELMNIHNEELQEKSFVIQDDSKWDTLSLNGNKSVLQRIFDNIYSNIIKYADSKEKIMIQSVSELGKFKISIANGIKENENKTESNKIGLRSIEKMMLQHLGTLEVFTYENVYQINLVFPILSDENKPL
ncbi:MAG: HAMP domain-containing sensor histidine kinase [Erysipelotrichaceae bacterium]